MVSPPGQCHQLKEPGPVFPVIASQCAHWRGNPFPLQRHDFLHVTKEKTDCHVASLLAMTVVDGTLALKLMTLPSGDDFEMCLPALPSVRQIGVCIDDGIIPSPGGKGDREAVDEEWRNLILWNAPKSNHTDFPIVLFNRTANKFGTYRRSSSAPVCAT